MIIKHTQIKKNKKNVLWVFIFWNNTHMCFKIMYVFIVFVIIISIIAELIWIYMYINMYVCCFKFMFYIISCDVYKIFSTIFKNICALKKNHIFLLLFFFCFVLSLNSYNLLKVVLFKTKKTKKNARACVFQKFNVCVFLDVSVLVFTICFKVVW